MVLHYIVIDIIMLAVLNLELLCRVAELSKLILQLALVDVSSRTMRHLRK